MSDRKNIAILGSTGSIGCNTIEVVQHVGAPCRIVALTGHQQVDKLVRQAVETSALAVGVSDDSRSDQAATSLKRAGSSARVYGGERGLCEIVQRDDVDIVVAAIVGSAGLAPVLAAVQAGKTIALANKESLVVGGSIVMPLARKTGATILPIDSEHSAVFQAMACGKRDEIARVILTASGGPFRTCSADEMRRAKPQAALAHPTWRMGDKVTIDSATMFNKALEIIEACWLFDLPPEKVSVVVHPESIVHSMVEFIDGSTIAQLSPPDMRTPIQYALTYPHRAPGIGRTMDWSRATTLNFEPPDDEKFGRVLRIAYEVVRKKGTLGAVVNAANEVAVRAFLDERIPLGVICDTVERTMTVHRIIAEPTLPQLMEADRWARDYASNLI